MNCNRTRRTGRGFTLVELVIVVLVLGIIAAAAAPRLFDTANDARDNSTRHSLTVLRNALELHRADNGNYPTEATITTALLPYLQGPFPAPQAGPNQNATTAPSAENPIVTVVAGTDGWAYNEATGEIRVNEAAMIAW